MDSEVAELEARIAARLPARWSLQFVDPGPMDDLVDAAAAVSYVWSSPDGAVFGGAAGPDRVEAARATLEELEGGFVRPGEAGAFTTRIDMVPLDLPGLPDDVIGLDVAPDGRWASIVSVEDPWLLTQDGLRLRLGREAWSVAWMEDRLVTHEGAWERVVVRARHGAVLAEWPCRRDLVVGSDWIAASDSDDPYGEWVDRLVVWNPDGTVRREWTVGCEDAEVLPLPGGGLALLGFFLGGLGPPWMLVQFEGVDAAPRTTPMPLRWKSFADGMRPIALGDDRFALVLRDTIWAWRAEDVAMTLIHEGPLVIGGREVEGSTPRLWLADGRLLVRVADRWWLIRISAQA